MGSRILSRENGLWCVKSKTVQIFRKAYSLRLALIRAAQPTCENSSCTPALGNDCGRTCEACLTLHPTGSTPLCSEPATGEITNFSWVSWVSWVSWYSHLASPQVHWFWPWIALSLLSSPHACLDLAVSPVLVLDPAPTMLIGGKGLFCFHKEIERHMAQKQNII